MARTKSRTLIMKTTKKLKTCEAPLYLPLKSLSQHPDNPREITRDGIDELKASIIAKGLYRPFLVWSHGDIILSGNQRYEAIRELVAEGYELPSGGVPVVYYKNPDPVMATKVMVESNTHKGRWVDEMLAKILKEANSKGQALDYGMDQAEIDRLVVETSKAADESLDKMTRESSERPEPGVSEPKEREKDQPLILPAEVYEQFMEVLGEIAEGLNEDWRKGDSIHEAAQALIQSIREHNLVEKILETDGIEEEE